MFSYDFGHNQDNFSVVNAYGLVVDLEMPGPYYDAVVYLPDDHFFTTLSDALHFAPTEIRANNIPLTVVYLRKTVAFIYGTSNSIALQDVTIFAHERRTVLDALSNGNAEFVSFVYDDPTSI